MGIINETAAFMCEAERQGVSFRKTLTIGRHLLYASEGTLRTLADKSGMDRSLVSAATGKYSEEFFKQFLKAEEISSLDYSDYEGADMTHDMNHPIPGHWEERYDALVDAGTLEHIFNFPVAISNCMRMVRTGGSLFIFTPANNQLGHGFYQFSPELLFRTLSRVNGFEIERMIAVQFKYIGTEFGSFSKQYEVKDPDLVKSRVTLANSHPVSLMVQARKIQHKNRLFETYPHQSDYSRLWEASAQEQGSPASASSGSLSRFQRLVMLLPRPIKEILKALIRLFPQSIKVALRNEYEKYFVHSFRNKTSYIPFRTRG